MASDQAPAKSTQAFDRVPQWGVLPKEAKQLLLDKEWLHPAHLKARLLGSRPFPIKINLKAPDGRMASDNMLHFQTFIESWQSYPKQECIEWESKSYRALGQQRIPRFFTLNRIQDLIEAIGADAKARSELWKRNMTPLLELSDTGIYAVLVKHLDTVEQMSSQDCLSLKALIEQLSINMGAGQYLRALPVVGVDTKFLESYQPLATDLLDAMHDGEVSAKGGLLGWLGCLENPKGWLCIRALCSEVQGKMGGFPVMQLPHNVLHTHELPAANILVVENLQSGLSLPTLADTIVVFGGGKNVAWMDAKWLNSKRVAYWGDIDTWGLAILSDARSKLPTVTALMMDMQTIMHFEDRMVEEPEPVKACPDYLSDSERAIFYGLKSGRFSASRLEQERLSSDYIVSAVERWLSEQ